MVHDLIYLHKKLSFIDKIDYVIIGINRINKKTYLNHKETFDSIILSGDLAWNTPLLGYELVAFVRYLDEHKQNLQLCNNNNGQGS